MDTISDFIISLKNATMAGRNSVVAPYSRLKHDIARTLHERGYLSAYEKKNRQVGAVLEVTLANGDGKSKIHDVKRISKPSRRVYMGVRDIHKVKHGHGMVVLSTPKGVMAGDTARKEQVGGEVLFEIW